MNDVKRYRTYFFKVFLNILFFPVFIRKSEFLIPIKQEYFTNFLLSTFELRNIATKAKD